MKKIELLVDLLLDSPWTVSGLEHILDATMRVGSRTPQDLAGRLSVQFPSPPSRQSLIDYLAQQSKELVRELRLRLLRRFERSTRFETVKMRVAIPAAIAWEIPPIANVGELAEFFNLPISLLDWLAAHRHSHYRVKTIHKRGSGVRLLEAPKARLKAVQHRITVEILNAVSLHPAAHGFVRGRSAVTYVQPHLDKSIVLRMDLMDFFPSITASRVFGCFRSLGYPYHVTQTLSNLCTAIASLDTFQCSVEHQLDAPRLSQAVGARLQALYCQRHLPQGAPSSPALANMIAYRLDCRLAGLAAAAEVEYTRYADDLLFSGRLSFGRSAKSFAVQVAAIALDEGFEVQFRKTRIMRGSTRQVAAGIVMNRRTNIRRDEYDQLKAILYNCAKHGPATQNRDQHHDFRMHLLGRINWVKQLHAVRGCKLMEMYESIDWN